MAPIKGEPNVRPRCDYYGDVYDARRRQLVLTNYAMYLASAEYSEGLGEFDLIILDEAHDADKALESFLTFEITLEDCQYLRTKGLKGASVSDWRNWAIHHKGPLANRLEQEEAGSPPSDSEGARERRTLKAILGKLKRLSDVEPLSWVTDHTPMGTKFAPVQVRKYAEPYLFRKIPHVLMLSATLTRKTSQMLGIEPADLDFWEVPSRFPLANRPIIVVNTNPEVRVDSKMSEDDKFMWLRRIDRIIEPRMNLNRKGIIHAVSYARMIDIVSRSEWKDWLMPHDKRNTQDVISEFKKRKGPWILISPSIITGYDFPEDQCRYQIIGKIPMLDMRDPIMSIRGELDKEYSGHETMVKLIQMCGRPVRRETDWAETFIVDDHANWFIRRNRKHAAKWFLDAIEYVESFPDPIRPEEV